MTDANSRKRHGPSQKSRQFIDNAGHMSPGHVERLRQLGHSSVAAAEAGFLRGLTESDQALADSIAEETVANMTSGQQQPPSEAELEGLEELTDLSIDVPADDAEAENTPAFPSGWFGSDGGSNR